MPEEQIDKRALDAARRILEDNGYRVSEKPIEWQEISAVITIKVQSPDFNETKFVHDLEEIIKPFFESRTKIVDRTGLDIRSYSGPSIKRFSRVTAIKRGETNV